MNIVQMPIASTAKCNVSGCRHENWRMDGPPPLIVNPQADLHALLAWCWGEASELETIATGCLGGEGFSTEQLANLFFHRLPGLVSVLEHLADRTLDRTKKGGEQ